jgi:hypothetical protein
MRRVERQVCPILLTSSRRKPDRAPSADSAQPVGEFPTHPAPRQPRRNAALQRQLLQSSPRYVGIGFTRPGATTSPVFFPRGPEDFARRTALAGFFFAISPPTIPAPSNPALASTQNAPARFPESRTVLN